MALTRIAEKLSPTKEFNDVNALCKRFLSSFFSNFLECSRMFSNVLECSRMFSNVLTPTLLSPQSENIKLSDAQTKGSSLPFSSLPLSFFFVFL